MRKENGITLVALVITVVIMLILVGISATAVIQSGLLSSVKRSGKEAETGTILDEVASVIAEKKIRQYAGDTKTFKQCLEDGISGPKTVEEIPGASDACYVTKDGRTITVYDDGTVEDGRIGIWEGQNSENSVACPEFQKEGSVWNWYIYTPAQLKFVADFVNNSNSLTEDLTTQVTNAGYTASNVKITTSTKVYLMSNLDMGARKEKGSTIEEKWETTANESKNWTPISAENVTAKRFKGTFEGQGHTIKGLYVNRTANYNGLFGNSHGSIRNLTIKDSYIKGRVATAGIVGVQRAGTIENCYVKDTTVILTSGAYYTVGGIAGQMSAGTTISACYNSGDVYAYAKNVEGYSFCRWCSWKNCGRNS